MANFVYEFPHDLLLSLVQDVAPPAALAHEEMAKPAISLTEKERWELWTACTLTDASAYETHSKIITPCCLILMLRSMSAD